MLIISAELFDPITSPISGMLRAAEVRDVLTLGHDCVIFVERNAQWIWGYLGAHFFFLETKQRMKDGKSSDYGHQHPDNDPKYTGLLKLTHTPKRPARTTTLRYSRTTLTPQRKKGPRA